MRTVRLFQLGCLFAMISVLVLSMAPSCSADSLEELEQEIATCARIEGDLERLECYDTISRARGLLMTSTTLPTEDAKGSWQTQITTDPLDDSTRVVLSLTAKSGTSSWGKPIYLILRCDSETTDVYIVWDDYLGSEANVTWRVGKSEAQRRRWPLSTDNEATFYPGDNIAFIKELLSVDSLVVQVTPYNDSPITAVFTLAGLEHAIGPLQEACGWQ